MVNLNYQNRIMICLNRYEKYEIIGAINVFWIMYIYEMTNKERISFKKSPND